MLSCTSTLMPTFFLTFSIVILEAAQIVVSQCHGSSSPFGIFPKGDHYVRHGNSLKLYCMLDTSNSQSAEYTSHDLSFFELVGSYRHDINSSILNETAIGTTLNLSLKPHYIYCSLKTNKSEEKYCSTYVEVGYEPQAVTNFSCISLNWEKLICRWYPPETYINKTEYTLSFNFLHDINKSGNGSKPSGKDRELRLPVSRCPRSFNKTKNICVLTANSKDPYRQPYEYYRFQLTGTNPLGNRTTYIDFHHYAHIIPNKPENIIIVNKTIGSAVVNWSIPYPMTAFPKGLQSKIEYKSKWDPPDKWNVILINKTAKNIAKTRLYNVTGLEYAHTVYDVRIYLKSALAAGDSYWSEPGTLTFVTPSTIPGKPPDTTYGSFDVAFNGNDSEVLVYWSRIPEYLENGEDFGYNVTCTMNNEYNCDPPIEKTLSYAKYAISSNNEYLFTIYSVNRVGRSVEGSQVFVPKLGSVPRPESFTNVPYANGVHELSWKPVRHRNLSNYTVFWCEEDQYLPLPCRGIINWVEVDKNVTEKNITVKSIKKFYKFAIAATLKDGSSSGMVWFSCLVLDDKVIRTVDVIIGNVSSREADIVWQIECARSSSFGAYLLYYCPVNTQNNDCQEQHSESMVPVYEVGKRSIKLTNLMPYTTYRLQISIVYNDTQLKVRPRTPPKRFTTLEDAPSEPRNLRKESVTNSSIVLSWDVPSETNGILQIYQLFIESKALREERTVIIEEKDSNNELVTQFKITGLSSYTSYNLTLRACTSQSKCSKPSTPIIVKTGAGVPGKMTWPRITCYDNFTADIAWERPVTAAGDLNYYELSVSVNGSYSNVSNMTGTRTNIPWPDWNTTFKIRAVNVDGSNVYKGPWSQSTSSHCTSVWTRHTPLLFSVFGICTFLAMSAALYYFVKRGWLHCRKMKDVEVKLPPGLQSQDLEKDNQDYVHLDRWPPRPSDTIPGSLGPIMAPDEESLLGKKSDECLDRDTPFNLSAKNGGDSSGCSVGRESMSSSLASDNNASPDSGAEADQCLTSVGAAFQEWGPLKTLSNSPDECTKNRDQNRKGCHTEDPMGFGGDSDWNASEQTTPGYTRVGFTEGPTADKLPEKGYVTIVNMTPLSPSQKIVNECNYSSLPLDNFPLLFDQEPPNPETGAKSVKNSQTTAPPCYVALACLQGRTADESFVPSALTNSCRPVLREDEKPENGNALYDGKDDEVSEESIENNSSGNETEKDGPLPKGSGPMPPYVSMVESPIHASKSEYIGEEEEVPDEDENDGETAEDLKLSPGLSVSSKKIVNGIDSALVDRISKDGGSYSNYIPHHIFGKE